MAGLLDIISARNPQQAQKRARGLLDEWSDPAAQLAAALREAIGADQLDKALAWRTGKLDAVTGSHDTAASVENDLTQASLNNALASIVSPARARMLNVSQKLPDDDLFRLAVANTQGAKLVDDGLMMRLQRNQLEDQALHPSVRGGVFYLPEGAAQAKYYSTGRNGYGGSEKITGETLIQNPIFAKGGTGGKVPEAAFDSLLGKGAYQKMRSDALDVSLGRRTGGMVEIEDFLAKYAPELKGQGQYILQNSKQGNQLAYALQEAAVGSAVRSAGHDAVVGYSKGKSGPFLSEVFDVRESHYPDTFGTSKVWESFLK